MRITFENYKIHLGVEQQKLFLKLANYNRSGKPIVLVAGILRYGNIDE